MSPWVFFPMSGRFSKCLAVLERSHPATSSFLPALAASFPKITGAAYRTDGVPRARLLFMTFSRFVVWKTRMCERELCTTILSRCKLDRYNRLGALCAGSGKPGHFDEPVLLQSEKPSVVRMPLPVVASFKKVRCIDL